MKKTGDNQATGRLAEILQLLSAFVAEMESSEGDQPFMEAQVKALFDLLYSAHARSDKLELKLDDKLVTVEFKAEYEWERKP